MNYRLSCVGLSALFRALAFSGFLTAVTPSPAATVEDKAADTKSEAFSLLRSSYVGFPDLQCQASDSLSDLERRSQGRISVLPVTAPTPETPVISALLPGQMIYCRVASFNPPGGWAGLAGQLKAWSAQGAEGLILDLRTTATPNDFAGAAQVAGLLLPTGTPLFSIHGSHGGAQAYACAGRSPGQTTAPFLGPMAVLINPRTSGAAEALAAALQAHGAVTLGRWTAGDGAQFADHPLPAQGRMLHYVVGDVTMADGTPLWRHPVSPDIGLLVDAKKEEIVLDLIAHNKILDVMAASPGSHRLSEAALVRDEDPSVEAYLVPTTKPLANSVPEDSVLVAALDGLKAIKISQEVPASTGAGETKSAPAIR